MKRRKYGGVHGYIGRTSRGKRAISKINKGLNPGNLAKAYAEVDKMKVSCPGKPEQLAGQPIGMYHCDYCGAMVIAGFPHPSDEAIREQGDIPYCELVKIPCPDCNGTGQKEYRSSTNPVQIGMVILECGTCYGAGKVLK